MTPERRDQLDDQSAATEPASRESQAPRSSSLAWVVSAAWALLVVATLLAGAKGAGPRQLLGLGVLAYLALWACYSLTSRHDAKGIVLRFVTFSASLAFPILCLEALGWFGVVDFRDVLGRALPPRFRSFNQLDPELIHVHPPHDRSYGTMHGGDIVAWYGAEPKTVIDFDILYDQHGFRNAADYTSADVIVIGDSIVEGSQVSSEELITSRMAQALGLTVANFGQYNYGPQQELVVLQRYGAPLRPKTCFWVFFEGNDFKDLWRYRELTANWEDVVAERNSPIERSFLKNALLALGSLGQPKLDGRRRSGVFSAGPERTRLWFSYDGAALTSSDLEALSITSGVLRDAYETCRRNGAKLVIVFAPEKFRVYADLLELEPDSLLRDWTVNDLPDRLGAVAGDISEDVEFVDLTPEFQAAARQGELLYYPDDTHWTPKGHRLAADILSGIVAGEESDAVASAR